MRDLWFHAAMRRRMMVTAAFLLGCEGSAGVHRDAALAAPDTGEGRLDGAVPATRGPFSESCTGAPQAVGRASRMLTSNNAAELTGVVLGSPDMIPGELRRPVTVTIDGSAGPIELGPAFVVRSSDERESAYVLTSVTITGGETRCFIRAKNVRWLDGAGAELALEDFHFVIGSMGDANGIFTSTCLGPGDRGYFLSLPEPTTAGAKTFSDVRSLHLAIDSGRLAVKAPGSLVPVAYRACGKRLFEVALESRGPEAIAFWLDHLGYFLLSDEKGPLDWGLLSPRGGLGVYEPGKTLLVGGAIYYDGAAIGLQVYADFDSTREYAPLRTPSPDLLWLQEEVRADRRRVARLSGY